MSASSTSLSCQPNRRVGREPCHLPDPMGAKERSADDGDIATECHDDREGLPRYNQAID